MPRTVLWTVCIAVLVVPPILLYLEPSSYTPVLAAIINGILFSMARLLGAEQAEQRGIRSANHRWLPQSESAMHRLLTVLNSVKSFRSDLSGICKIACADIPELDKPENKAIKILLNGHCRNGSTRLGDIANHLDDALTDWSRFVQANCEGEDCVRIFRIMKEKKDGLEAQLKASSDNTNCPHRGGDRTTA